MAVATKGLEFDAVLLYDPTQKKYPADNGHVKLLYVAATRALHELVVLYHGNLSRILTGSARDLASSCCVSPYWMRSSFMRCPNVHVGDPALRAKDRSDKSTEESLYSFSEHHSPRSWNTLLSPRILFVNE